MLNATAFVPETIGSQKENVGDDHSRRERKRMIYPIRTFIRDGLTRI